jgi:hypothetical protein
MFLPFKCNVYRYSAGDVSYQANVGWSGDRGDGGETSSPHSLPQLRSLATSNGGDDDGDGSLSDAEKERAKAIHCKLLRIKVSEYDRGGGCNK